MVLVRMVVVVVWGCVVPAAWCLSLPPPSSPHHHPRPDPLAHPHLGPLLPPDLPNDAPLPLDSLDESQLLRDLQESSYPYRLQEEPVGGEDLPTDAELAEAAAAVVGSAGGRREGGVAWVDPRYYLLDDYLSRPDDGGSNTDDSNSQGSHNLGGMIRKARNSRDSTTTSTENNSSSITSNSSSNTKRAWPHGFSRRRSGLSLSIDASMKVLREALYLEIARKKQRQQLQRAQQNKAILNSIGKRDVSAQLKSYHRNTPTLVHRN